MQRIQESWIILAFAALFTFLFYHEEPGINLFIFESLFIVLLAVRKQLNIKSVLQLTLFLGLILTLLATVITHSVFSYFMNFIALFLFVGGQAYPTSRSMVSSFFTAVSNMFPSQWRLLRSLSEMSVRGQRLGPFLGRLAVFIVPLAVVIVFILIYSASSPWFNEMMGVVTQGIRDVIEYISQNVEFELIALFVFGMVLSGFLWLSRKSERVVRYDVEAGDQMDAPATMPELTSVKKGGEYRAAVFLFGLLNVLILILNVLDITKVWFGFEWNGSYLKQLVHEGTFLLIFSILISIGIVLYIFRGKLNTIRGNTFLHWLAYAWLAQNAVLVISVGIRNFWYIHYFALAYKRIGVMVFLLLTLYGLYTVFVKVNQQYSTFYLLRRNTYAMFVILILASLPDWDSMIARYNFNHADKAFLHLDYMSTLSDHSLHILDVPVEEIRSATAGQEQRFDLNERIDYMTPEQYAERIKWRKDSFRKRWERRGWLSWNYADYNACRRL